MKNQVSQHPVSLTRNLSGFDSITLIVGNMIGIGIFTTTGYIADYIHSPAFLFLVWILGGLYAFCGALTYAELSTRFPFAGGDYHYLKHAYHPVAGFMFGWSAFAVTYTGSIATIAVGFASYFLNLFPESVRVWKIFLPWVNIPVGSEKIVALFSVALITFVNSRGLRKGAVLQNWLTGLGVAILLGMVIGGFASGKGDGSHFSPFLPQSVDARSLSLLGVALVGVVFTYSGWTTIVYIAGEVKNPRRNLPFSLAFSVILVLVLYLLVNAVYLYALPLTKMIDVVDIGYRTLYQLLGKNAGLLFSVLIMLVVLSTLNSTILSGARIYFAMAKEGRFFQSAGKLHSRWRVPANSLWMQALWATVLILSGSFNQLLTYTVFIMVVFSVLSGVGIFVLRKKEGLPPEIYRAWGYPLAPLLYLIISLWIMLNTLYHRPVESLAGVAIVLLGIPFYLWWKRTDVRGAEEK